MNKNKRIILIVLFVMGICICGWSIYNSIVTITENSNNSAANQNTQKNNSQTTGNNKSAVVIDNDKDSSSSDEDSDSDNKDKNTSSNNTNSDNTNSNTANNSTGKYIEYTVKDAETLKDICKNYEEKCPSTILTKAILDANNLKNSNDVKAGMKLRIPEKYITNGISYTVKSGDSLSSIATKYMKDSKLNDAVKAILNDNFLSNDTIRTGDLLFIETTDTSAANAGVNDKDTNKDDDKNDTNDDKSTSTMSTLTSRIGTLTDYTVIQGDTLDSISSKYSDTCPKQIAAKVILKANNLSKSTDIKVGMKIKLPEHYLTTGEIYTVGNGDTLYNIVLKNMPNVNVTTGIQILTDDNGIQNNNIMAGQKLFIASITE